MKLRGIEFNSVFQEAGATNFFGPGRGRGHGWLYHKLLRPFGLNWDNTTFVSKTTTFLGGDPSFSTIEVTRIDPRSYTINRSWNAVLTADGLNGPGIRYLLETNEWQKRTDPFFISVTSDAVIPALRIGEFSAIFDALHYQRCRSVKTNFGIQIVLPRPDETTGAISTEEEARLILEAAHPLHEAIPIILSLGPETPPCAIRELAKHPRCDGIHFCSALPFGRYPTWAKGLSPIDWHELFGASEPDKSPMHQKSPGFAGELSGEPLLPFVVAWVQQVRALGITIPICAGGGVLNWQSAALLIDTGADAIALGSIATLAPTKVQKTIAGIHRYFSRHATKPRLSAVPEYNV